MASGTRELAEVKPAEWVPLAQVARPHGVKGELRLKLFNRESELLLTQEEVLVRLKTGEEHEVSVTSARPSDGAILMKLYSVDDRDRADDLREAMICVKRSDFPALDAGEFYACDLIDASVVVKDQEMRRVGSVRSLETYPSVDVLAVRADDGGKDWEVPFVEAFVESVDVGERLVVLKSLEGVERA